MLDRNATRFVYFIRPSGWDSPVKIGCSVYPMSRLSALMAWSPFPLEILATAPGGTGDERRLHLRFAADRLRGEWFRTTRDLIGLIDSVAKTGSLPFEISGTQRGKLPGLRRILKRHGLSRKQIADTAGVSVACVTQWATDPYNSGAGCVIETLGVLGIECTLAELHEDARTARAREDAA